jgi:hypothetical protein
MKNIGFSYKSHMTTLGKPYDYPMTICLEDRDKVGTRTNHPYAS